MKSEHIHGTHTLGDMTISFCDKSKIQLLIAQAKVVTA